jgi:putative transposase
LTASRKVLPWRLSNTLDTLVLHRQPGRGHNTVGDNERYGTPDICHTDQGSEFTSEAFTDALSNNGIEVSSDACGRWMDNIFIERLS